MQISIDARRMIRDISDVVGGVDAMGETTDRIGYAAVMTGHRRGTDQERERRKIQIRNIRAAGVRRAAPFAYRIMTGWGIANFLASKGHDPFDYPPGDVEFVGSAIEEEVAEALEDAYRTGRSQKMRIKRVLDAGARHLRDAAKEQIEEGRLGKNKHNYRLRKMRRVKDGIYTDEYGNPPPYGVATGQFVKGIRNTFFDRRRPPRNV